MFFKKKEIFCKDCKRYKGIEKGYHICNIPRKKKDFFTGEIVYEVVNCCTQNSDLKCEYFKPKKT